MVLDGDPITVRCIVRTYKEPASSMESAEDDQAGIRLVTNARIIYFGSDWPGDTNNLIYWDGAGNRAHEGVWEQRAGNPSYDGSRMTAHYEIMMRRIDTTPASLPWPPTE
jgi:hypothetical protein